MRDDLDFSAQGGKSTHQNYSARPRDIVQDSHKVLRVLFFPLSKKVQIIPHNNSLSLTPTNFYNEIFS